MSSHARLIPTREPKSPSGVVLVLHGGAARGEAMMVSPAQLSVLRMIPIARRVARAGRRRLAVFRLLNSVRGWDSRHTPVDDARWALDRIADRLGGRLPTCLIGHSLGGRAALLAADAPEVRSAVALAPWVHLYDGDRRLPGRQVLVVHGSQDRVADPARSLAVARALGRSAEIGYVRIEGGKHAMLARHAQFDGLAADFAVATLLGRPGGPVIDRVLDGEGWISL